MSYNETFTEEYKPKTVKKILALILCTALFFSCFPISAFAAEKEANTPKEEVVYVSLGADGSVKNIYVVNIFDLDKDGKIIDYGRYESVRNMTTTDEISYSSEKVTVDTKAGKLYYEGKLDTNVMPWNVSIKYYINGTELSGEQVAGKSGDLKITLKITENTEYKGDFFKGYALQTSLSLNTKNCRNINAPGATLANVGVNKQITYTILPGKGIDTEITANVTDFAFDGISINGIKLNLNIDIDENAINEKIDTLMGAVKDLNDGAGTLNDGAKELYNGTSTLNGKVGELLSGVGSLADGSATLLDGLNTIDSNSDALVNGAYAAFGGMCSAAGTMINAKLSENGFAAVTLTPENYAEELPRLLEMLSEDNVIALANEKIENMIKNEPETVYRLCLEKLLASQLKELNDAEKEALLNEKLNDLTDDFKRLLEQQFVDSADVKAEIDAAIAAAGEARESISALKAQLDDYNTFYEGIKTYTSAVGDVANGMNTLNDGVGTLNDNAGLLGTAIGQINDGAKALYEGTSQLKTGTQTFLDKTSGLKDEVRNIIDTMMSTALGKDIAINSFVSEDNENVLAVQFVIKTEAVAVEAPLTPPAEPEKPKNFWQKLLALFGIKS